MRRIQRVLGVSVITLVTFVVAVFALQDDARAGCVASAPTDPSYEAELLGQVDTSVTTYRLSITRDGEPVADALVCFDVAMRGMNAMGLSETAVEVVPGIYEISIFFEMAGPWKGDVLISEDGRPPSRLELEFDVQ